MIHDSQSSKEILRSLSYDRVAIVTDKHVESLVWPQMDELHPFSKIVIDPGESSKSQATVSFILDQMHQAGLSRKSLLVGLGGGVVTDLAGYCASIYMRGIDVMHIPTTLLAMVDAAIGGKTGINTHWGKNMVGTFHTPVAILYFPDVLQHLPKRHHKAGFVEAWKTTIMCKPNVWKEMEYPLTRKQITDVAETKLTLVETDITEKGKRAWLNFGHSFGHAFEHLYHLEYGLLHGEAIAWGMLTEMYFIDENTHYRSFWTNWVKANIPPLPYKPEHCNQVIELMRSDKKNSADGQYFALPFPSGSKIVAVDEGQQREALRWLETIIYH